MNPEQKQKKGGARLRRSSGKDSAAGGTGRPGASTIKRPKPQRTKKEKIIRATLIGATVVAGIIVAAAIFIALFVRKPPQLEQSRPTRNPGTTAADPEGSPPGEVSSDRKEDFYTFMVVGRDTYGGGNTDTILLASYNIPDQKLNVMSIPRDTLVNVSWDIKKINSVYNMYGGGDKGMSALKDEVSQLVGFKPDYTVTIEWEAVGKLVEAVGGVYFDVPRNMYYNDLSQNFKIDLKKGYQKLNGAQAMQLLRWRHNSDDSGHILNTGYADGDLGRIKTQQAFLKATIEQCLKNITKLDTISALAQVFFDNVKTELDVGNLAWFAQQAILGNNKGSKLSMENVEFITMPWESANGVWSRTYNNHPSYVAPSMDELVKLVNQNFNPYIDDLRKSELDIMFVNNDGTLGSTGGVLEDTKYNAWVKGKGSSGSSSGSSGGGSGSSSGSSTEEEEPAESTKPTPNPTHSAQPSTTPAPGGTHSPAPSPETSAAPTPVPTPVPSTPQVEAPPEGIPIYTPDPNAVSVLPAMPKSVETTP